MIAVPLLTLALAAELSIQPGTARPGDAVLVRVAGVGAPAGTLGGEALRFTPSASGYQALTALPVEQAPGTLPVTVTARGDGGVVKLHGVLEVQPADFRRRELTVSSRFTSISKADRARSAADRRAFAVAFDQPLAPLMAGGRFTWPRLAEITAPFGDLRLLNGKKKSQHFGMDLDGAIGDPVVAAQAGEVVMTRDCFGSGNTVLLHHGGRLFTAYFHLSSIAVEQGQQVQQGQPLGAVGRTGRVTGPHLHFGARVGGLWVDPESVLRLDFAGPPGS